MLKRDKEKGKDAAEEKMNTPETAPETAAETATEKETGACETEQAKEIPRRDAEKNGEKSGEAKTETGAPEEEAKPEEKKQEETKQEEDIRTQYMRLAADFQNFRKRTEKEKGDIYARANESLMLDLLPVLDDFERALALKDEAAKGVQEGVQMIVTKYVGVLQKHGLSEIEALGKDFDPNFHHAVQMCPAEGDNSGKVTNVLQKGYLLNGKVIRPAMVIVAE